MNEKFSEFYKELNLILKKYSDAGICHEQIIGGLECAKTYVKFLLEEEYKRRTVIDSWEAIKKYHGQELARSELPIITEDN